MEKERRHKRIPLTAHVRLLIGESEHPAVGHSTVGEISLGGVGLYLVFPLEVGVKVKLGIRFIAVGGVVTETVQGKSVYTYHIQDFDYDLYYVGIKFARELNPKDQPDLYSRIQNIIKSY